MRNGVIINSIQHTTTFYKNKRNNVKKKASLLYIDPLIIIKVRRQSDVGA